MDKIRLVVVAGIRSHYIKTYAFQTMYSQLSRDLQDSFSIEYIDAGQHYDYVLAAGFIEKLGVKFDERITYKTRKSDEIIGQMFLKLSKLIDVVLTKSKIDYIVVFGDVATTMVASTLAAIKGIPLIHIEAGSRSGKERGPEEGFRVLADHLAELLFVSSMQHMHFLYNEGLEKNAFFSGDIIYDIVMHKKTEIKDNKFEMMVDGQMKTNNENEYVLASLHHMENASKEMLGKVFYAFTAINSKIYFIAHPRIKQVIHQLSFDKERIIFLDYISYLDNLKAMKGSRYIVTDSGGMQRESYYLGKRCLVRQGQAFWQALIDCGINVLMGSTEKEMIDRVRWMEENYHDNSMRASSEEFGNGNAVETIFRTIKEYHQKSRIVHII